MRTVFADTLYWVALINPKTSDTPACWPLATRSRWARLMTTDEVLTEVLNFYAEQGSHARQRAATKVRAILRNTNVEVITQTHDQFLDGLALYEARRDKGYSLTDCISMNVMRADSLSDVLTHGDHFQQEGFTILL